MICRAHPKAALRWLSRRADALCMLALLCLAVPAHAEFGPPPAAPDVGIEQRLDVQLPLALALTDAHSRHVRLGDYFQGKRPVVLVLGYYSCPNLCGMLMHGTLEALQASGLSASQYALVGVSIDPQDTPDSAAQRGQAYDRYARFLQDSHPDATAPARPQLLVGSAAATSALARRVGFSYAPGADMSERTARGGRPVRTTAVAGNGNAAARFAHATGVVIVTPDGRISRYFMGVRFEPQALRGALVAASSGRIGTLADRIALLCAHFDPRRGRYSADVMNGLRVLGILLTLALAGFAWRHRSGRNPQEGGEA